MKNRRSASASQASSQSSNDKWRQVIAAQQASGQTVAAYCREHRIGQVSFYGWKRRFKASAANPEGAQSVRAGFVELTAAREAGVPAGVFPPGPATILSPAGIEVVVNGRRVLVHPGFNRELLTEVIQVLEKQV
jgi:hypothetical protein